MKEYALKASRHYTAVHPDRRRDVYLRRRYGITIEQHDAMFLAQGGLCAICRQPETTMVRGKPQRLSVDHDPETGRVRGLLCRWCNGRIGILETFGKRPQVMEYLK